MSASAETPMEGVETTPTPEQEAQAEALRVEGNDAFKGKRFITAVAKYTEAIDLKPSPQLYGNRAFANLKLEAFGAVIQDATSALELDPRYLKGYYRRGSAQAALGKFKAARKDFRTVVAVRPKDANAKRMLKEVEKQIREAAFRDAIEHEDTQSVWDKVDDNAMAVPGDYSGPRLPTDGPITVEYVKEVMEHFRLQRMIPKKDVVAILRRARAALQALPTLVRIAGPNAEATADGAPAAAAGGGGESASYAKFNVCGDTHGQYYDTINIFKKVAGMPSEQNPYLFNGDYVDRGSFSVENVLLLLLFKLALPNHFHMLRGNHESRTLTRMYGFAGEVRHKLDVNVLEMFYDVFCCLPLAAVIGDKVLVVHGGLCTKDGVTLADIESTRRIQEPPESGIMTDLLWSDPQPFPGRGPSKRGVGLSFGPDITAGFLQANNLELMIRSHEVKDDGYLQEHTVDGVPRCYTVFSAPNYCDASGNKGAVAQLGPDLKPKFLQFDAVPHPPIKPMAFAAGMGSLFGLT